MDPAQRRSNLSAGESHATRFLRTRWHSLSHQSKRPLVLTCPGRCDLHKQGRRAYHAPQRRRRNHAATRDGGQESDAQWRKGVGPVGTSERVEGMLHLMQSPLLRLSSLAPRPPCASQTILLPPASGLEGGAQRILAASFVECGTLRAARPCRLGAELAVTSARRKPPQKRLR